jgi:hypothetical protein
MSAPFRENVKTTWTCVWKSNFGRRKNGEEGKWKRRDEG